MKKRVGVMLSRMVWVNRNSSNQRHHHSEHEAVVLLMEKMGARN
jgi:hypothetical protein